MARTSGFFTQAGRGYMRLKPEQVNRYLSFGDSGRTSLKAGLGETSADKMVISNTPGAVYEDLIIMPLRVSEGTDAALGHIQAFNIRTGKLAWVFHTIPHPGEFGYETFPKGCLQKYI